MGSSTWLSKQAIPEQRELSQRIDDATTLFQLQSLSDSQKAKRGEKFKKKAERQAEMINLIQKCRWQRKDALQDLLVHGRNARIGTDVAKLSGTTDETEGHETRFSDTVSAPFLEKVGDDIDDVSPMMRDISFYYEQKRNLSEEKTKPEITSYHYEPLELIANPETRQEGYMRIVDEFEKLDLTKFEYKNNDEFMNNTGNNTFVQRYAQLRAFSHVGKMLPVIGRAAYGDERYFRLYAKAALLEDILTDYKRRTMLIQSPYYVLLGGKNFDSLSKDDLTLRI
ncbi:MAG: hypothetical protein K6G83_10520 [Lachnospiraceae bacterium]|nr:hypothetical protein [Lachnospiraceae bacterium]